MLDIAKRAALGLTVALGFFVLLEGILWVVGVVPLYERVDPYVGFAGHSPLFVPQTRPDGKRVYATAPTKQVWFNPQQFPARKADEATRIFCLGGSTTYGRPYDDRTSFCGWLRAFLPAVDPDRRWEVVNAGGISYASYRLVRLMQDLTDHEPDLFVIYTGHNEFLEARTYDRLRQIPQVVRDLASLASRLRIYSLLADITYPPKDVLSTEVDAVLDDSVGPEDYSRDDALREAVLDHFEVSLERMVRMGRQAGARLIFVTPASNIRDFSPFKAEPSDSLDAAGVRRIAELKEAAAVAMADDDPEGAAQLLAQALATDPRDAELHYQHGRALLSLGRYREAREAFVIARDEDVAPLRALTPIPETVAAVALQSEAGLVDFARLVRERAAHRIPGDDLFLDHVHPSIEGNRLLGLAIVDEMVEMDLVTPASTWNQAAIDAISERVASSIDETDRARALTNLSKVLEWAGKRQEAQRLVDRAMSMAPDDGQALLQKAFVLERAERHEEALPYAVKAVELMPQSPLAHRGLGILLAKLGRTAEARQELETALRLDPQLLDTQYHLALALSHLGLTARAESAYRRALAEDPGHADACNNLGILLAKGGDLDAALALFERALRSEPEHAGARANRERALRLSGR